MHQQDKTDPARFYPILCHPAQNKEVKQSPGKRKEKQHRKEEYLQEGKRKGENLERKIATTSNRKAGEISKNKQERQRERERKREGEREREGGRDSLRQF